MKLDFDPGALRPIGDAQLARARALVPGSKRSRAIVRYHEHDERVQRMLNAIEPASYVRPHKHEDPDKVEVFVALAGRARVCTFDDEGALESALEISASGPCRGVEIPPRTWHSLVSLEPGTVLYEVIEGPYAPATHKEFAPWSPAEGTPEGDAFLRRLRVALSLPPAAP